MAAKKPVIAMMYDFDKTLCTTDMQEYTFIPNLGMSADEFWAKASKLAEDKKMDRILAYMYLMLDEAHVHRISIRRDDFVALGQTASLVFECFRSVESAAECVKAYVHRRTYYTKLERIRVAHRHRLLAAARNRVRRCAARAKIWYNAIILTKL